MYDVERIKKEADCREVARYIGMKMDRTFCECVSGLHQETRINHCAIYRDHIHCFSCGDNRDVLGMVLGYYQNVLCVTISYADACGIVGDALGGRELYWVKGRNKGFRKEPELPFTDEELKLLGLQKSSPGRSLAAIFRQDPPCAMALVCSCAEAELQRIDELESTLTAGSAFEAQVKTALQKRRSQVVSVMKKCGGTENRVRKMFTL